MFFGSLTIFVGGYRMLKKNVSLLMETISLYEALLNLPSLIIHSVILEDKRILITCSLRQISRKCSICQKESNTIHQSYLRTLRDLNISDREVYLQVDIRQFYCKKCDKYFSESSPLADFHKSHTDRQRDFILFLLIQVVML